METATENDVSEYKTPGSKKYGEDVINYTVRLPKSLKDTLRDDAKEHGRSLNHHLVLIISEYMAGQLIPVEKLMQNASIRNIIKQVAEESAREALAQERDI